MKSKLPAENGVVEDLQQHRDSIAAMSKPGSPFKPTELDRALERDPVVEAAHRDLLAASQKETSAVEALADEEQPQPDTAKEQANREGQKEAAAASLAGGMIAAEGRPVTAAEAVEKEQEVLDELKRRE